MGVRGARDDDGPPTQEAPADGRSGAIVTTLISLSHDARARGYYGRYGSGDDRNSTVRVGSTANSLCERWIGADSLYFLNIRTITSAMFGQMLRRAGLEAVMIGRRCGAILRSVPLLGRLDLEKRGVRPHQWVKRRLPPVLGRLHALAALLAAWRLRVARTRREGLYYGNRPDCLATGAPVHIHGQDQRAR